MRSNRPRSIKSPKRRRPVTPPASEPGREFRSRPCRTARRPRESPAVGRPCGGRRRCVLPFNSESVTWAREALSELKEARGAPPGPRDLVFGRGLPKVLEKAVRNSRGSFQPLEQDSCGRNAICSSSPRVCFVGTLARGGENFALISELLRHSSPTMLDYYFRTGATERARAVGRMAATS